MVHTQSQHIFLALAALALAAGPLAGTAAAVPGDDGDIDLAVDGSIRSQDARQLMMPAAVPGPVDRLTYQAAVQLRSDELAVPNPVGHVDALAATPLYIGPEGVSAEGAGFILPWYYMMDDANVRPYHALYWNTGTAWYIALADELWFTYVGAPNPTYGVRHLAPDLWVTTAVDEIDLSYRLDLLLASTATDGQRSLFQRPDAAAATGADALSQVRDEAVAPDASLLAGSTVPDAAGADAAVAAPPGVLRSAQAAPPESILNQAPLQVAALASAGLVAAVAGYHLIRKSAILKNKVRSSIAEHVLRQPGSTITEIAQAVGVTHQTASYHLRLLQEHGLVLGVERGNKRLYFRNDGSFNNEERGLVAVLRDPESMRVLELIRTNPWIMKNEAAAALGVSRNTLNWHLQKLLGAGLVSEARENGHCFLFCNRRAAGEVMTQVVQKVEERRGVPPAMGLPPTSGPSLAGAMLPEHERLGA